MRVSTTRHLFYSVLLSACQSGVPYRPRPHRCLLSSFIAFLLLTIEKNPGPGLTRFGLFNADGANYKGAGISGLIHDNRLDVLAVCKSWIREDAPDAVKLDMVPSNFAVLLLWSSINLSSSNSLNVLCQHT